MITFLLKMKRKTVKSLHKGKNVLGWMYHYEKIIIISREDYRLWCPDQPICKSQAARARLTQQAVAQTQLCTN